MIFNALASGNQDAVQNEWVTLDNCLTHPTPYGEYHYHMWSPCYKKGNGYASTSVAPNMCKDTMECHKDPMQFAINAAFTDTSTYGEIIGVTKDGHLVYGPYNSNGELWSCEEHDVCNGTFIDGNYVYVSTTTFPYILGCFGPGPQQEYGVTCTTSTCPSTGLNAAVMVQALSAITVSLAALLYI